MIEYHEYTLDNGLRVILHEDHTTPLVAINVLYQVGSRNEEEDKTGFAHLFEHLMFGGSVNVKNFDEELQKVGGDNNAFTNTDITNYYVTLPAQNLETGLWVESDRMLQLAFDHKVLDVQRNVVIEEFKQRYLNQPYGDIWLHLRPLAYQVHPYRWPTIGREISHIQNARLEDVRDFFNKFYYPANAILVVAGNIQQNQTLDLIQKWFGSINGKTHNLSHLPKEPEQYEYRFKEVSSAVPIDALYKVYHMPGRMDPEYYPTDLICDILGHGKSSRLYQTLVKQKAVFNQIDAYLLGSFDPGLLVIAGKLNADHSLDEADKYVNEVLNELITNGPDDQELEKVKNQAESTILFSETELLNRAIGLAMSKALGNVDLINQEIDIIRSVTKSQIVSEIDKIIRETNCSTLYYKSNRN